MRRLHGRRGMYRGYDEGKWPSYRQSGRGSFPYCLNVNPATPQSGTVVVRFKLLQNGQLMDGSTVLEKGSGQALLDKAVLDAIGRSAYPHLPEEFHGADLDLRVYWLYNSHPAKQHN